MCYYFVFAEQDVNGEALLSINTNLIRSFIPSLSLGKCMQFFRKFEPYRSKTPSSSMVEIHTQKDASTSSSSGVELFSPSVHELEEPSELTTVESSFEFPCSSLETSSTGTPTTKENITTCFAGSSPPVGVTSIGMSFSDFPIHRVIFPPEAKEMISSGKHSLAGKAAITTAMVSLLLELSSSSW